MSKYYVTINDEKTIKQGAIFFRLSKELCGELDKFAEELEVGRSEAIRLLLTDGINKYSTGSDEMSKIIPISRTKKLKIELEKLTNDENFTKSGSIRQKEMINEVMKKFA